MDIIYDSKKINPMDINSNFLVSISNEMVEKPYSLTATEQIVIELLASNIQPNDTEFKPLQFKTKEFMSALEIKNKSTYTEIKAICKGLLKKGFKHSYIDEKGSKITLMVNWLSSAKIDETEGLIELKFDDNLKPYLLKLNELKSGFTSYKLKNPINLRSAKDGYHIRIYKLLKKYEKIGSRRISVYELKEMLGIQSDKYRLYTDFRRWVLLKAQNNINANTDIKFSFEEFKSGRKITTLEFKIKPNYKVHDIPKEYKEALQDEEIFEELVSLGINPKTAKSFVDRYPAEQIKNNIFYAKKENENGRVKNFSSFLVNAIKDNYSHNSNLFNFNKKIEEEENSKKAQEHIDKIKAKEKKKRDNEEILNKLKKDYEIYYNRLLKEYLTTNSYQIQKYIKEYLADCEIGSSDMGHVSLLLDREPQHIVDKIFNINYIPLKLYIIKKYLNLNFINFAKDRGYTIKATKDPNNPKYSNYEIIE